MGIPLSFLLGFVVLLLHDLVAPTLPGAGSLVGLLSCLPLLAVPAGFTLLVHGRIKTKLGQGIVPGRTDILLFRAAPMTVPLVYAVLIFGAGLQDLVERFADGFHTVLLAGIALPLLWLEVSLRLAETRWLEALERAGFGRIAQPGIERLPATVFLLVPLFLIASVMDIVFLDRDLEVFFVATALGTLTGFFLLLLLLALTLPLMFRLVLPTSRDLKSPHTADIRATAKALDFPPNAVLRLDTRHRAVNAAMVGPMPWPRYLVLTDGLLSLLDSFSLRGVVAHEVAHARANHPAILITMLLLVPMLWLHPILLVQGAFEGWTLAVLGLLAIAVGWFLLWRTSHRFELEADQMAAEALGGAAPTILALRRVGELSPQSAHQGAFRHPSEHRRIQNLLECERNPEHRRRFHARGRRLRVVLLLLLVISVIASGLAQVRLWDEDRIIVALRTGQFPEAARMFARLEEPDDAWAKRGRKLLHEEVEAALVLAPEGLSSADDLEGFARAAYQRGTTTLASDGPVMARPWFQLSMLARSPDPRQRSLALLTRAATAGDQEMVARVQAHLDRLPP